MRTVTLNEVLAALKEIMPRPILVTGPQRSGTTIAAHILAKELDCRYVDEIEFGWHDHRRARAILAEGGVVMQGPGLCHFAHRYARTGAVIVMMRRNVDDILKSEARIDWRGKDGSNLRYEQEKYQAMFGVTGDNIALIKYQCWDNLQKMHCTSFDLDYDSMSTHPLWRAKSDRKWFRPRQWRP